MRMPAFQIHGIDESEYEQADPQRRQITEKVDPYIHPWVPELACL